MVNFKKNRRIIAFYLPHPIHGHILASISVGRIVCGYRQGDWNVVLDRSLNQSETIHQEPICVDETLPRRILPPPAITWS